MKRYILIGAYEQEELINLSRCIDIINKSEKPSDDFIKSYIWENHKENLEQFDLLFLITEDYEVVARISQFTNIEFLRASVEENGDLSNYNPVYVDVAEWDERSFLAELLNVDFDDIKNI